MDTIQGVKLIFFSPPLPPDLLVAMCFKRNTIVIIKIVFRCTSKKKFESTPLYLTEFFFSSAELAAMKAKMEQLEQKLSQSQKTTPPKPKGKSNVLKKLLFKI